MPMVECEEAEKCRSENTLPVIFTGFIEILHLALVELIKCRGGVGPWFDEFQANVIREVKYPLADGVKASDEIQLTYVATHMAKLAFEGAREDFDNKFTRRKEQLLEP